MEQDEDFSAALNLHKQLNTRSSRKPPVLKEKSDTDYPTKEVITGKEKQPKDLAYDVDLRETESFGNEILDNLNFPKEIPIPTPPERKSSSAKNWKEATYINCDLRYFPLGLLGSDFDVVLIDPPWRVRGKQHQYNANEKTMFSNSDYSLNYHTLSNQEILDVDVGCLSKQGFIFLWVINSQLQLGFECLNKWGYNYIDKLTWVKKTAKENLAVGQGYYFLHSSEICLVGVKTLQDSSKPLEFHSKVTTDVIFEVCRKQSEKPKQLYEIIEKMMPGAKKVELFARNHNIREGWLSLGDQLGEYFDWGVNKITCDDCKEQIKIGFPRHKSRTEHKDICEKCFLDAGGESENYFILVNNVDEMVFHQWYQCNGCGVTPIWGIRFHCSDCDDLDLCEDCYDKVFLVPPHEENHKWNAHEVPEKGGGFAVHQSRCKGCGMSPIIGFEFNCVPCQNVTFCQKCFFLKKTVQYHTPDHQIELRVESKQIHKVRCDICKVKVKGLKYKCDNCFDYKLCETCFTKDLPPPLSNTSHRKYHTFTPVQGKKK